MVEAARLQHDLLAWFAENARDLPWRDPELSPYEVLLAEVLLARTAAENVAPVYEQVLDRYPDPNSLAAANPTEVANLIRPLGLQNKRASALVDIATTLQDEDGVPADAKALQEFSWVGPYAANATLCFGFDRAVPIVDTNVARIYERIFGFDAGKPRDDEGLQELAADLVPDDPADARRYNLALLDFGALICTARSPYCEDCFANDYCEYYQSTRQSQSMTGDDDSNA